VIEFLNTTWNSATSTDGCINLFARTALSDLNPIPSELQPADFVGAATTYYAASKLNMAFAYGYSKGLTVPLRSSIFRNLLQQTDAVAAETALEYAPQITFVAALAHGVYTEYNAAVNGECQ
jgi:hypothetical protein